jgi:prevent-host-death family protein
MTRVVSAAEANRNFSSLLRTVKSGNIVVITSHGKPVARLVPAGEQELTAERARAALLARLRAARTVDVGRWTRDELYDDE